MTEEHQEIHQKSISHDKQKD